MLHCSMAPGLQTNREAREGQDAKLQPLLSPQRRFEGPWVQGEGHSIRAILSISPVKMASWFHTGLSLVLSEISVRASNFLTLTEWRLMQWSLSTTGHQCVPSVQLSSQQHTCALVTWWVHHRHNYTPTYSHIHRCCICKKIVFKRNDGNESCIFKKVEASLRETMLFFSSFQSVNKRVVGWINVLFCRGHYLQFQE